MSTRYMARFPSNLTTLHEQAMDGKIPGIVEMDESHEKDVDYDVEDGKINALTMWQRLSNIFSFTTKIKPGQSFGNLETPQEFTDRRNSFLKKFAHRDEHPASNGTKDIATRFEYLNEKVKQPICSKTVIDPEGTFFYAWLAIVTVAWMYSMWMLIVRQAFHEFQEDMLILWLVLDYFSDFIYTLDFIVQLRTGYLENGLLVYEASKLAKNYIFSRWFVVDILSLTPLDIIFVTTGTVQPLLRFPRFFKIYRAKAFARRAESRTSYPNVLRVVNLCHMLVLLIHWFACFYYMISESEGFFIKEGEDRGWAYPLPRNESSNSEWTGLRRKYLHSLYWACLTLTTIGEKQSPDTDIQYVCTLFAYFLGIFVFATVVGQVGNVIANKNMDRLQFERLVDNAKTFMKTKGVSKDMQTRILRWYDYSWSRGILRGAADVNALGMIPDTLKVELAIRVNMDTLRKVSIFKLVQPEFLYALVLKMKSYVFTPGDLVCRKGEVAREMFIINHGVLNVVNDCGHVVASLGAGDFFGEIGVLNIVNGVNKRVANVVSVGYSEVFSLAGKEVLKAMEYYPDAKNLLLVYGRQRFNQTQSAEANGPTMTSCQNLSSSNVSSDASLVSVRLKERRKRELALRRRELGTRGSDKVRKHYTLTKKLSRSMRASTSVPPKGNESCALLSISGAATAVAASVPEGQSVAPAATSTDICESLDSLGESQCAPVQYANVSNHQQAQNTRIEAKLDYLTGLLRRGESWDNPSRGSSASSDKDLDLKKMIEEQEKEILEKDKEVESLKQDVQLLINKLTLSMSGGESGEDAFLRSSLQKTSTHKSVTNSQESTTQKSRNKEEPGDIQNLIQRFMFRRQSKSVKKSNDQRLLTRPKTDGNLGHFLADNDIVFCDGKEDGSLTHASTSKGGGGFTEGGSTENHELHLEESPSNNEISTTGTGAGATPDEPVTDAINEDTDEASSSRRPQEDLLDDIDEILQEENSNE